MLKRCLASPALMPIHFPRNFLPLSPRVGLTIPKRGLADLAIGLGVLTLLYIVSRVGAESFVRFNPPDIIPTINLDPHNLPNYAAQG